MKDLISSVQQSTHPELWTSFRTSSAIIYAIVYFAGGQVNEAVKRARHLFKDYCVYPARSPKHLYLTHDIGLIAIHGGDVQLVKEVMVKMFNEFPGEPCRRLLRFVHSFS